ncbi:MAG: hypothetical protein A3I68_02805 [Candidatus Melainabacteria bacterium RIFCSPLOWO2_02_FULL_35_15]|nr:MAG: hypothetical protein A3F80_02400 [Candidatus Melainabacteria bacterium RIFCSPLOWO2_12_FULL_35_11]OGI13059.1 MAG: hypothetical protein A3I68_02805 [Candidatus Melainabacteria bacterium RIFCSPLOWO2_02_FULL_35_15]
MPNVGIDVHARNIGNLLAAAGPNRAARQQAIAIYLQANVDQFTGNPQLINGVINRLPNAAGLIRQAVNRLLPPPQLPPGIIIADINARRIFHGGNRPDNVDRMWANFTNAMRGRVFNINEHTNGLVQRWLTGERLENGRPASEGTPAQRGTALAHAGWRDNFFSAMELAAVFQYSQTLNENDRTQFQQAFVQEFTKEVQRKFPGQERYILMQFTRFINNTNWDSNDPITQGFRTFMNSLMNGQGEASLTPEQTRQLQNNPGTMVVLATYDIPDERGNFGAACLVGSYERQANGELKFQTRVISHRPGPPQNRWRFDFGQVQQPAQPNRQPAPGFGNLLEWIQQWLQQLQPVPPVQPQPAGGVGRPQPPIQRINLSSLSRNGGVLRNLPPGFSFRVGTDVNAPVLRPGEVDPRTGISINAMGGYSMPDSTPLGTRVSILDANGRVVGVTTVENAITEANRRRHITPGGTERIDFGGNPPRFSVRINNGQPLDPDGVSRSGIKVHADGRIEVAASALTGTTITLRTESGQEITRVVEPDINTTGLAEGAANLDSRLEVPAALNLRVRLLGDQNPPRNLTNEWQDLGNDIRVRRGPGGEVQFNRVPGAPDVGVIPLEFTTEGGQSAIVQYDVQPPAVPDQALGDPLNPVAPLNGRLLLPPGVRITGVRLERSALGIPEEANFTDVNLGNTEFNPLHHASGFTVSADGHIDATVLADNAIFVIRLSDGRELRVTTSNPGFPPV